MTYILPLNKMHVVTETISNRLYKIRSCPVSLCYRAPCYIYLFRSLQRFIVGKNQQVKNQSYIYPCSLQKELFTSNKMELANIIYNQQKE
jgi:hypothetical protein